MIVYYVKKLIATARTILVIARYGEQVEPGVVRLSGTIKEGPVWFDFSDTTLVHLGDQLFHVFLVRHLASRGADVWVATPSLQKLFASLGAKVGTPQAAPRLIVSKNDAAPAAKKQFPKSTFLGIGYGGMRSTDRVASDIARLTLKELSDQGAELGNAGDVSYDNIDFTPDSAGSEWLAKLQQIDEGKGFLGWNATIASGQLQGNARRGEVHAKARELRDAGYRIVQLGSKGERETEGPAPDFVDLDLRGYVSPEDTFAFLKAPGVRGIVSFDNFLVHVATLTGSQVWVVYRYAKRIEEFRARYIPFFPSQKDVVAWWR